MLLVSRWTIRLRVVGYGIQEITGYSSITDEELDTIVQAFGGQHGSLIGCSIVNGHLRSLGRRLQRQRVRESIARVDPTNAEQDGQLHCQEGLIESQGQTIYGT